MQFKKDQYVVKRLGDLETITITKGALCEWAGYYDKEVANADSKMVRDYCAGRRDVLFDIISHFFADGELNFTDGGVRYERELAY